MATSKKSNIGLDSFINWGATIVIIGLMFKLQHWQWGDWMIVIGLGAEAIIFLILGYQAIGNSEEQETKPSVAAVQTGHAASLDAMLSQSDISPQDIQNLGKGLSRFSTTVESLSEMATTTIQVNEFTEKLQTVSSSFDRFSSAFEKASRDLESFGVSTVDTVAYQEQINRLSKNLEALNGIYEKELSQANSSFVSMSAHYDRIAETLTNLNDSAAETKVFKDQVDLLNKNLASLNAVYGNMLAAMSQPRVN